MMKKLMIGVALACLTAAGLSGCYSTGKATGEAAEEVEQGADRFEEGYEAGKDK